MTWQNREIKAEQLSDEWFEARMGCLTGSIVGDIMPNTRGGYSKAREMLLYKKAVEFMANKDESDPIPKRYSDWGHEYEDEAIRAVSEESGIPFFSSCTTTFPCFTTSTTSNFPIVPWSGSCPPPLG